MPSLQSRRQFLTGTLRGGGVGLGYTTVRPRLALAANDLDPAAVHKLAVKLHGRVVVPSDSEYDRVRRVNFWNPRTDRKPALIARCQSDQDVARAIEFAHRHSLPASVRAGGHSYLGWGTCDGGLLIDISGMNGLTIDPSKRTGRAQGGVLTGSFVAGAGRYGLAPVSGECAAVGLAGLTLGGGLGWLSSKHGAACDNVHSARLITASSRSVRTDASRDADLFWAIRGGGGNFGIVTGFEFLLHPIREVVAGDLSYRFEDALRVLQFYREFMATAPDEFHAELTLLTRAAVNVSVCYCGDLAEGERLLQPWRTLASARRDTVKRMAYTDLHRMPTARTSAQTTLSIINGLYLPRLSDSVFETILDRLRQAPERTAIGLGHYMHGAVCRVPADATAFELRTPDAVHLRVNASWQDPAASDSYMEWTDHTADLLRRYSNGRIYANFQSVEGREAGIGVFGRNYSRLRTIKKQYDPANFFQRNPNVTATVRPAH